MTPQEQFEYKTRWMPGFPVRYHTDKRFKAQDWCKTYCKAHEYQIRRDVEPYVDHVLFEHYSDAALFEEEINGC